MSSEKLKKICYYIIVRSDTLNNKTNSLSFKRKFKDMDKQLLIATILLIIIGTLSIVSASSRETVSRYDYSVYHYFFKHMEMLGIAILGSIIIFKFPTKSYRLFAPILWIAILCCLIGLFIYSSIKRGSINWLTIMGFTFQPSEFAKPIIIATLSIFFEIMANRYLKNPKFNTLIFLILWIVLGLLIPGIVFLQGDLGTALILIGISGFMYLYGPLERKKKFKYLSWMFVIFIVAAFGLYMKRGYLLTDEQLSRFDFFNPCSKYEDNGYQICNGLIAINNGGITGLGIGKSQQKYSYIPDPHTDSIFSIIIEEAGLITGIVIIFLYAWMLRRIYKIAVNASTIRGRYIAFGAMVYLSLHIIFNLGGLLAILPLTGVPLPLISYGGSFTISFLAMLTMVQCVAVETKNQKIKITSN